MVKKYKISVMMFNHWFTKGLEHSGWRVVKGLDENDRLIRIEFDEKIITLWYDSELPTEEMFEFVRLEDGY